jgi:hypothetical protein
MIFFITVPRCTGCRNVDNVNIGISPSQGKAPWRAVHDIARPCRAVGPARSELSLKHRVRTGGRCAAQITAAGSAMPRWAAGDSQRVRRRRVPAQ